MLTGNGVFFCASVQSYKASQTVQQQQVQTMQQQKNNATGYKRIQRHKTRNIRLSFHVCKQNCMKKWYNIVIQ